MPFKLELGQPNEKTTVAAAKPLRPAFGFDDANDELQPDRADPGSLLAKRTLQRSTEENNEVDESIYDFDATYDALHAKEAEEKAAKKVAAAERRSQYMGGLLASAEIRKRDQLRYREKVLQREREASDCRCLVRTPKGIQWRYGLLRMPGVASFPLLFWLL